MTYFSFSAFLTGLPVGLFLSLSLGPVFFTLIQSSIQNGFRSSIFIALGVIFADILLLGFAYSGVQLFLPSQENQTKFIVELLGGIMVAAMGIASLLKKSIPNVAETNKRSNGKYILDIAKGFLLNILNPTNFLAWMATAAYLSSTMKYSTVQDYSFYTGSLISIYLTELTVGFSANRLQKILNPKTVQAINKFIGLVFLCIGLFILWKAFKA